MNCIIIDDEPLAIKVIQTHVEQISGLKILATFEDAMDGFTFMQQQKVDLLLLDIQMIFYYFPVINENQDWLGQSVTS